MASLLAHSVGLALVLGHAGVDLLDDIETDRAGEDSRQGVRALAGLAIAANDGDGRSGRHFEMLWRVS